MRDMEATIGGTRVKRFGSIAFALFGLCIATKAQTRDITKELVALEQNFNDALVRSDWKVIEQLYADNVTFTNSDGSVSHKIGYHRRDSVRQHEIRVH